MKSSKQEVIIIAGANGSGKTTFAKELLRSFAYSYLNADEIAKKLNVDDLTKVRISAGREFLNQLSKLITKRKNIIIESTLSGQYLVKLIDKLKDKGYIVTIFFILVDTPQECIHRIKQRVLKGEHSVPKNDVIRRFYRGRANFWTKYRFLVDFWYLIDNSGYNFEDIALGIKDNYEVINTKLYKIFIRGAFNNNEK